MKVGSKGLCNVDLVIPQHANMDFTIYHNDSTGNAVDHTHSTFNMVVRTKKQDIDVSQYCLGTQTGVVISIPGSVTAGIPVGDMPWDIFATMQSGEIVRLAYGIAHVVDTYAMDGK